MEQINVSKYLNGHLEEKNEGCRAKESRFQTCILHEFSISIHVYDKSFWKTQRISKMKAPGLNSNSSLCDQ